MSVERELIRTDIEEYLRRYQGKELLRFVAVGSVDDGKSTLIGRLLYDTGSVYEDQLAAVRKASHMEGTDIDLSLLTDGLAAEREQGITIDVAYRYFSTDKRKFIIADTPGHTQYTRNMVTGASTASVAIILIDARLGVLQQSRRHAYIASLLGIPHLAVCVNKMDLVAYDRSVFTRIQAEFAAFTRAPSFGFTSVTFFPISALDGSNCVHRSTTMPWYEGRTVLEFLESVPVDAGLHRASFRYPVQYVVRPNLAYRGFAGRVASGFAKKGDAVMVLPSGKTSRIKAIDTFDGELPVASAPRSVTLRLEDEIDVSRGDMLVHPDDVPRMTRTFDAHVVWMSDAGLDPGKSYLLKHTTQTVRVDIDRVHWRKDMDTLEERPTPTLALNDIGRVTLTTHRVLFVDPYASNRETGSFILIDSITNGTVGAGMVIADATALGAGQDLDEALRDAREGERGRSRSQVSPTERRERFGVSPGVLVLAGRAAERTQELAYAVERRLFDSGGSGVVLSWPGFAESLSAARAVVDAGLLAIVPVDPTHFDEAAAVAQMGGRGLLVVRPEPGATSLDDRADAVLAAVKKCGWLG